MTHPRYIVGIDLGTTNTVLAYTQVPDSDAQKPQITLFPLPQVVDAGRVEERPLLPSFLFLPGPHDVKESDLDLPWGNNMRAVGEIRSRTGSRDSFSSGFFRQVMVVPQRRGSEQTDSSLGRFRGNRKSLPS